MPTTDVRVTIPVAPHLIEVDAARLQAKKTIIPAATDAHGTQVQSIVHSPNNPNSSDLVIRVVS